MQTTQAQAHAVRDAIRDGLATSATVTTLERLFSGEATPKAATGIKGTSGRDGKSTGRAKATGAVKKAPKVAARTQAIPIPSDATQDLAPKERYALATEVVNSTLKVLTEALKTSKPSRRRSLANESHDPSTPSSPQRQSGTSSAISHRALQPKSGNATPVKKRATKSKPSSLASQDEPSTCHIIATGECSRLGFSFLRSVDPRKMGVRKLPPLQLENGMIALASKLVAHGLESLALKELRFLKHRLEHAGAGKAATHSERETLATLLRLDVDFQKHAEILPVAIAHQNLVLRIIAMSRKPASIEAGIEFLDFTCDSNPTNLITLQGKHSGDLEKTGRLLESLSSAILSLCPNASSTADEEAMDREVSPAPDCALRLQTIGLDIRRRWWTMVQHQPDVEKELLEPLSRCTKAFIRRSPPTEQTLKTAQDVVRLFTTDLTIPSSAGNTAICQALADLAKRIGCATEAKTWSEKMLQNCTDLPAKHTKRLAVLARLDQLAILAGTRCRYLVDLRTSLHSKLAGSSEDFEFLLIELSQLLSSLRRLDPSAPDSDDARLLLVPSAAFALRFARSYSGKDVAFVQSILCDALRLGSDSSSWISQDAAGILIGTGTLERVARTAATLPAEQAWSVDSVTASLKQVLKSLIGRAVKSGREPAEVLLEIGSMSASEQGCALEVQLAALLEHISRPRYHDALRPILHEVLRRLHTVYTSSAHPIRRANVAAKVLRLREACPQLLPPHRLQVWLDTDLQTGAMGSDSDLVSYKDSVSVCLHVANLFHHGQPDLAALSSLINDVKRLLLPATNTARLAATIYDVKDLDSSLSAISALLRALDRGTQRLVVLDLQSRLGEMCGSSTSGVIDAKVELAKQLVHLGYAEQARHLLDNLHVSSFLKSSDTLAKIHFHVACAEVHCAVDQSCESRSDLGEAERLRELLPVKDVSRDRRNAYERVHVEGWLVHSRCCLLEGNSVQALVAAKHAVKVLNSTWVRLEKGEEPATPDTATEEAVEASDPDEADIKSGVSKLRLPPLGDARATPSESKGAAFWPVIPLLYKALTHLSDLYAHHGLFPEANHYSSKAVEIADSIKGSFYASRSRSHRAALLSLAGEQEDAELCLAGGEVIDLVDAPLAAFERLRCEAAIRSRDSSVEDAQKLYAQAERLLAKMKPPMLSSDPDHKSATEDITGRMGALSLEQPKSANTKQPNPRAKRSTRGVPTANRSKAVASAQQQVNARNRRTAATSSAHEAITSHYMLDKLRARLLFDRFLSGDRGSKDSSELFSSISASAAGARWQRQIQHRRLFEQAALSMQSDVTYSILPESTLAYPAIFSAPEAKSDQRKRVAKQDFGDTLQEAHKCLFAAQAEVFRHCATSDVYIEESGLAQTTMLLSASNPTGLYSALNPVQASFSLDNARVHALECEYAVVASDNRPEQHSTPFEWPASSGCENGLRMNSVDFQADYIDILPKPWTAVSLTMNEACSELYAVRYQACQTPFTISLPFARSQAEDSDTCFDFEAGKTELSDIIQLSNYSCHNNGDVSSKTAKSTWWTEREALDRRLQELLINMEDLWFGGFKGVLSPKAREVQLLSQFKKSFGGILDRHLPSRKAVKGRAKKLVLDDHILELFVNLGSDQDGNVDLDEPISDLLYFAVDMLLFNGERNAYDEVDFDQMTVEVQDALKVYHEASEQTQHADAHVVLVLDKRLQAFPWENLPCLADVSVSRVGSMLALRDCITAMRTACSEDITGARHTVTRNSGSYILNPSSDLGGTQVSLEPALRKAASVKDGKWTSVVNRAPSEDDFRTTLEDSAVTLYFGHGAGSQYIRPRTIRKLGKCSEVVWLMGCSSGAVTEHGELEPQAVPLAYLLAGKRALHPNGADDSEQSELPKQEAQNSKCLSVVATLWDVTDKDIDRFSLAVGEEWGLWPASSEPTKLPAKTPRKRDMMLAPSTPQQMPKTPKTPKVKKTPAAAKTPSRSRSRQGQKEPRDTSLTEAVAKSRDSCYLRYLNGAAPVVYGIPVYLGD